MAKHGKTSQTVASASAAETKTASRARPSYSTDPTRDTPEAVAAIVYDLRFDILRSALYHGAREHWLSFWHRAAIGAGLLAGAAAISAALNGAPKWLYLTVGIIVTVVSIFDLVFDWGGVARLHVRMRERFFGLLSEIEQIENPAKELRRLRARLAESYQDEPPVYHALNELMWNHAYESLSENFDSKKCRKVVGWRRLFAQVLPQRGHNFCPD